MAGSYNHIIDKKTGALRTPKSICEMLDTGGDVVEAVEEMYGMIWYLASAIAGDYSTRRKSEEEIRVSMVEEARKHYLEGLKISPTKRFKE